MSQKIEAGKYISMYGPTVGDKVRLGDTDLFTCFYFLTHIYHLPYLINPFVFAFSNDCTIVASLVCPSVKALNPNIL